MPKPYFFFRPLLAKNHAWAAFYWQTDKPETVEAADYASCFDESGVASLANKTPLILPTDPAWLAQSEFIQKFEANQAIFVLPANILDDAASIERCKALRKHGQHCALQVEKAEIIRQIPVAAFNYLQFDAGFVRHKLPALELHYTSDAGFKKIAHAVHSHEQFDWLAAHHFELCDSRFITELDPNAGKEPDLTRLKLLKLLSLVAQDADTREIEEIFREEPKLSYNLLRLVNSVAVGAKTSIGSFHQAIAILGRRQLQRWLQLLIYADQLAHVNVPNPLMQLAAARGRQMELLVGAIEPAIDIPEFGDTAFMTGIFSLLDVLLNLPMNGIIDALPLQTDIRDALSSRQGVLGHLLNAITASESGDFVSAADTLAQLGISPSRHATAQTAALFWASGINLD
jgi:EAL and modified HD-GYP domain-containing signal transduction protein